MQQAAVASQRSGEALALLQRRYVASPSIDVLEAIIALGGTPALPDDAPSNAAVAAEPRDGYIAHLAHHPSLVAASRWLAGERQDVLDFQNGNRSGMAEDVDGDPVLLATSGYAFNYIKEKWPKIRFTDIKETQARPVEG